MKENKFDPIGMVMKYLKVFTKPEEKGLLEESMEPVTKPVKVPAKEESFSSVDLFLPILGKLEGEKDHKDHLGITTKAFGLVNDPKNQPSATNANLAAARKLGFDLGKATPEQSKEIASLRMSQLEASLAKEVPNWNNLSPQGRVLLLDAKYNTGITYRKLAQAIEQYEKNPTKQLLRDVVTQSRRLSNGKPHKGLDNRAATVLAKMGYLNSPKDAKALGLDLASV